MKSGFSFCIIYIHLVIISSFVLFLNCDRIKSKIYKPIESKYFCFRRLNATNQIGCNSNERGNVGVVHLINTDKDMNHVLKSGPHSPYIAVITAKYLNLKNLSEFKRNSDRISGVVVLDISPENRTELEHYSPDKSCPNVRFSLYVNDSAYGQCGQQNWNLADERNSEGIMFNDWPFPIFFVRNQTNINQIKDCFNRFHGPDWPLCAIELDAPMNAAKDSVTCMRRTNMQKNSYSLSQTYYCDPLGGTNIFNTLFKTSKNDIIRKKSIIVVAARMDSFSMFDNISPGADSAITSVVVLLSIAETLSKMKDKFVDQNVLFALFDGEAFDYIGSSRMVYDMSAGKFPIDPKSSIDLAQIRIEHLSHFIELNQLASHGSDDNLYIHKNLDSNKEKTKKLFELIQTNAKYVSLDVSAINESRPLPPSSLQSFLKKDNSLVGVVIANHEKEYSNKFYNSLYDDYSNVNKTVKDLKLSTKLTKLSTLISKTVYNLLTNGKDLANDANETTVEQLLDCYLQNSVCDLHKYVSSPNQSFPETMEPYQTYVGVYQPGMTPRYYTLLLLSYLSGDWMSETKDKCNELNTKSNDYNYYWMAGPTNSGVCVKSQAQQRPAISPAFENEGNVENPKLYSTWTESRWTRSSARLFIMPSALQQWLTLITGLIILLFSFVVIYLLDKHSEKLFNTCDDIGPQQTLTVTL